jgi:hypothetical protein
MVPTGYRPSYQTRPLAMLGVYNTERGRNIFIVIGALNMDSLRLMRLRMVK